MDKVIVRDEAVAGLFYSADKNELIAGVDTLLEKAAVKISSGGDLRALIVPHAGYVYSGEVASWGFAQIDPEAEYKRVILIGASHKFSFDAVSVCNIKAYKTPLGEVEVDQQLADDIIASNANIEYFSDAHSDEHSLEVQLPFLQRRLKKPFKILPVIVGSGDISVIRRVADSFKPYFNRDNLFVISTDFSHYPQYHDAVEQDNITAETIQGNDPEALINLLEKHKKQKVPGMVTGLCGWPAVLLLQYLTSNKQGITYNHLLYQNSGDKLQHNHDRVVGYHSFAIVEKKGFDFCLRAKQQLLNVVHASLREHFGEVGEKNSRVEPELNQMHGAFVSVYVEGKLRGCIGTFHPTQSLGDLVGRLVVDAAIYDDRFDAVCKDELDNVSVEISVLGPLEPISSIDEIVIGRHGIYMRKGVHSGTLLPVVAVRNGWGVEEFLTCCAEKKARIGRDGWRDAELFVYETMVIADTEVC